MTKRRIFAAVLIAAGFAQPALAGDAAAGEQAYMARGCIGCHGPGGHSANPDVYPSTAGRSEAYLTEQLNAFRNGERQNPMMTPMVAGLTDDDVANLAAYLAAQEAGQASR